MIKFDSQFPKTPEETELEWYKNIYKGDIPQLTFRAIVMGVFLGWITSLANLYISLKVGLRLSIGITACILSYSIYDAFHKLMLEFFKSEAPRPHEPVPKVSF